MADTAHEESQDLFWADQLAKKITARESFHYLDKPVPEFREFVVKTSASLSGVLHIGRLSDTIRGESVVTALRDLGAKTRFIWVAENMDPLRKVPAGVPASYEKYIGMPVTDIPDPDGNYDSYADRHMEEYFEVLDNFVTAKMEKFSMRAEYKKGHFNKYIRKILDKIEEVKDIQNKYRTNPLKKGWSPWTPICDNCGKIVTPRITETKDGVVNYVCEDYKFEAAVAKGCGHRGDNDPLKSNGKLLWKSEWAAQWARWNVSSEGAGKEYQVPGSAFWVNGEIAEKILDFPMPEPIFYEHIMIDNAKMSASVGNVVYPRDWLEVASPEILRLFYNKRLMTTRSFSWKDLPSLYDEYDYLAKVYAGFEKIENRKEEMHCRRLFEISCGNKIKEPMWMSFSHAAMVAQAFSDVADVISSLKKTGHYKEGQHDAIFDRLQKAKAWLEKYAPEEIKFKVQDNAPKGLKLENGQKMALRKLADLLMEKDYDENTLFQEFYNLIKEFNIKGPEFFKAAYNVLLNKDRGPKLAPFIVAIGKEKAAGLFMGV